MRLAKANHAEFSSLFFSNAVTQSTRVRIDILKALVKKQSTPTETAYVQGFLSRPILQYRVKDGARSSAEGVGRSYTFVDAIAKFVSKFLSRDLTTAYLRAGDTFHGALSQYFVVLSDQDIGRVTRTGGNQVPLGRRGAPVGRSRGWPRSLSQRPRQTPNLSDRGVKRAGDPSDITPSKRKENEN